MNSAATSKLTFGFWVYLMTDCVLFASLFAAYAVLQHSTAGGPSGKELFSLPFVFTETLILLTSSYTTGLGMLAVHQLDKRRVMMWFSLTFLLGIAFLTMELSEFSKLAADGTGWQRSAFLSAFFTLVGTHGLHIATGLLWMSVLGVQLIRRGLTQGLVSRLTLLSLFWHFLDLIWIFIFTIVYLMGVI